MSSHLHRGRNADPALPVVDQLGIRGGPREVCLPDAAIMHQAIRRGELAFEHDNFLLYSIGFYVMSRCSAGRGAQKRGRGRCPALSSARCVASSAGAREEPARHTTNAPFELHAMVTTYIGRLWQLWIAAS